MKLKRRTVAEFITELASIVSILLILMLSGILLNENLSQNFNKLDSASQLAETIYKSCQNTSINYGCYHDEISHLAEKSDFKLSLQVLKKLQKINPQLFYCHGIGHKLSIIAVKKSPTNLFDHLKYVSPQECSSGFLHGTIEGLLQIDQDFTLNSKSTENICNKMSASIEYLDTNRIKKIQNSCMHSMGHILLVTNNANVDNAVSNCPSSSVDLKYSCFKGIFMENFSKENLVFHGIAKPLVINDEEIKKSEIKCGQYSDSAALACWEGISTLYVHITGSSYKEVLNYCKHAPEEDLSFNCYLRGIGEILSRSNINLKKFVERSILCSPYLNIDSQYIKCINFVLTHELESQFVGSAVNFCESIAESYINYCFKRLIGYSDVLLNLEEKERFCRKPAQKYKNLSTFENLCSGSD